MERGRDMAEMDDEERALRYVRRMAEGGRRGGELDFSDPDAVAFLVTRLGGVKTLERHAPGVLDLIRRTVAMPPEKRVCPGETPVVSGGKYIDRFEDGCTIHNIVYKPSGQRSAAANNAAAEIMDFSAGVLFNFRECVTGVLGGELFDCTREYYVPLASLYEDVRGVKSQTVDLRGQLAPAKSGTRELMLNWSFYHDRVNIDGESFMRAPTFNAYLALMDNASIITGFTAEAPVSKPEHASEQNVKIYYWRGSQSDYDYSYNKQSITPATPEIDIWVPLSFRFGVTEGHDILKLDFEDSWQFFLYTLPMGSGQVRYYGDLGKMKLDKTLKDGKTVALRCRLDPEWLSSLTNVNNHWTVQNIHFDIPVVIAHGANKSRATLIMSSDPDNVPSSTMIKLKPLQILWGCLAKGTRVLMEDGTEKPVEAIRPGDAVRDAQGRAAPVVDVVFGKEAEIMRLVTESGLTIDASGDHPFMTPGGARRAGDLWAGLSVMVFRNGAHVAEKLASAERLPYGGDVYNLRFGEERVLVCNGFLVGDHEAQQTAGKLSTNTLDVVRSATPDPLDAEWARLAAVLKSRPQPRYGAADTVDKAGAEDWGGENIGLHYFAVKMLALEAGFSPEDAQRIAEFCQYTGDNTAGDAIAVESCPPELDMQHLVREKDGTVFACCPASALDAAALRDVEKLLDPETQRRILVPFHYFPPEKLDFRPGCSYRTETCSPVLGEYLYLVAENYCASGAQSALPRIGVLAHVLSDCFTHRFFSGLESDANAAELLEATDRVNGKSVMDDFDGAALPPVGAARTGGAVDAAGIDFRIRMGNGAENADRNTARFRDAAHAVHSFLLRCLGKTPMGRDHFEARYGDLLSRARSPYRPGRDELYELWRTEYPDGCFAYDRDAVAAALRNAPEDFFHFALALDDVANLAEKRPVVFTADPEFTDGQCRVAVAVLADGTEACSFSYVFYRDDRPIGSDLVEIKKGERRFDHEIILPDESLLQSGSSFFIKTECEGSGRTFRKGKSIALPSAPVPVGKRWLAHPLGSNPVTQITLAVNGTENPLADYCYPENTRKLILPVVLKMELSRHYDVDEEFAATLELIAQQTGAKLVYAGRAPVLTRVGDYLVLEFSPDWGVPSGQFGGARLWRVDGTVELGFRHKKYPYFYRPRKTIRLGTLCTQGIHIAWTGETP